MTNAEPETAGLTARQAELKRILQLAWEQRGKDGEIEFDYGDVPDEEGVSEGDDNGCYVRAWVWVDFADTDLDKETPCGLCDHPRGEHDDERCTDCMLAERPDQAHEFTEDAADDV